MKALSHHGRRQPQTGARKVALVNTRNSKPTPDFSMGGPKITPSDLRRQAEAMLANGTMPSLETVLAAMASTREEYRPKIREAQRQAKIHVVKPSQRKTA